MELMVSVLHGVNGASPLVPENTGKVLKVKFHKWCLLNSNFTLLSERQNVKSPREHCMSSVMPSPEEGSGSVSRLLKMQRNRKFILSTDLETLCSTDRVTINLLALRELKSQTVTLKIKLKLGGRGI